MLVTYDPASRATYVRLADRAVVSTAEISDLVSVDLDAHGEPVGVEFLMLPHRISGEVLRQIANRFPTLKLLVEESDHWLPPTSERDPLRATVALRA